jgi:anaerobic magnesium-protoporphyrin IX monomethyl ester cyclase
MSGKNLDSLKVVLVYPNTVNREAFPPMGIAYIASYLYQQGISVEIIDLNFEPDLEVFRKKIVLSMADVIGFSYTSPLAPSAYRCMEICKEELPGTVVVAGGPHPTIVPHESFDNQCIDYVVVGEGEVTFLELLKCLVNKDSLLKVQGICYRNGGDNSIIQNVPREAMDSLDKLPQINWNLFPNIEKYLQYSGNALPVMTSRGCPYSCSFCQPTLDKIFGKKLRYRSPEKVIQELSDLKKANLIKSFVFQDDTFTVQKSWVKEFCRLAKEKKLKLRFACNSRVDTLTEEMLKEMSEIGLYKIALGVESGSQRVLDDILSKGTSLEKIIEIFDLTKKYGILANAFIMLGSPNETKEDIEKTIELLQRIKPNWVSCTRTVLLPETYMWEYSNKQGLLLADDDYLEHLHYADHSSKTHKINITDSELRRLKNKLYRKWAFATITERAVLKIGIIFFTIVGTISPRLARLLGNLLSRVIWVPPPVYS